MVYLPFPNSRYTPFGHSILVAYLSRGMLHAVQITEVKFTKKVFGWIADKKNSGYYLSICSLVLVSKGCWIISFVYGLNFFPWGPVTFASSLVTLSLNIKEMFMPQVNQRIFLNLKTLWFLFTDEVQLSRGYRATTRRQFTFND